MKNFLILFFVTSVQITFAQITKLNTEHLENNQQLVKYDSLKNISIENLNQQIGQTLYLKENESSKKNYGGYSNFYIKPIFGYYYFENNVYKAIPMKLNSRLEVSNYGALKEKYYLVNKIILNPDKDEYEKNGNGYIQLIQKESGDTMYFSFEKYGYTLHDFLTVGYFQKLKIKFIGKDFVYVHLDDKGLISLETKDERTDIPKNTIFKCYDVVIEDGQYSSIIALLENDKYGKFYVLIENLISAESETWNNKFEILSVYKSRIAKESVRKNNLVKKYGTKNAELILKEKVRIGMSKSMCKESWGEPEKINKTSGSYGVHEQWVYGNGSYLYFENGILTTIQN